MMLDLGKLARPGWRERVATKVTVVGRAKTHGQIGRFGGGRREESLLLRPRSCVFVSDDTGYCCRSDGFLKHVSCIAVLRRRPKE
jgi:hypothetical protein